jgi:hypothetical protein
LFQQAAKPALRANMWFFRKRHVDQFSVVEFIVPFGEVADLKILLEAHQSSCP